tara:strand:+ start:1984 stop:2850 length:867 start_codon:yes stop_codon:yes gene_type:complete
MLTKYNCCPDSRSTDKITYNNKFEDFIFCRECSLLFRKDILDHKKKVLLFDKFNKNVNEVINSDYYKTQIAENKSIINKILSITKKKPKKILDYGCGYGVFMFAAQELGFVAKGYDINENFTKNLANYFETFNSEIDLINKNNFNKYDLIYCRKVLTLSSNIYKDFSNFNDLLSSDGHLVVMDQVKNFSKYKSIMSTNNQNNTLLLTTESLKYFANIFQLKAKYIKNDFGDILIIFERSKRRYKNKKISIQTLKVFERYNLVFLFLSKIKGIIKKIYYFFFVKGKKNL